MFFCYGEKEKDYLRRKDKRMSVVIERVGDICREVDSDLFSSLIHHIVGQQISTKAQATIWQRFVDEFGAIEPSAIAAAELERIQKLGVSFRKASYIQDCAARVESGEFDLSAVQEMSDDDAVKQLITLKGIGVWTAEMILLFCLQRPNVFSFDDLAIHRGLRMLYRHRAIDRTLFEKYRRRFSPYCSVASLYLWAVAGGTLPELTDCGGSSKKKRA